jgi:hypothetical protein
VATEADLWRIVKETPRVYPKAIRELLPNGIEALEKYAVRNPTMARSENFPAFCWNCILQALLAKAWKIKSQNGEDMPWETEVNERKRAKTLRDAAKVVNEFPQEFFLIASDAFKQLGAQDAVLDTSRRERRDGRDFHRDFNPFRNDAERLALLLKVAADSFDKKAAAANAAWRSRRRLGPIDLGKQLNSQNARPDVFGTGVAFGCAVFARHFTAGGLPQLGAMPPDNVGQPLWAVASAFEADVKGTDPDERRTGEKVSRFVKRNPLATYVGWQDQLGLLDVLASTRQSQHFD